MLHENVLGNSGKSSFHNQKFACSYAYGPNHLAPGLYISLLLIKAHML